MIERNLTIKEIKSDITEKGKKFYKVYFNERTYPYHDKQTNVQQQGHKVHFVWPDTQAYQMLNEKQVQVGMKVQIDVKEKNSFLSIETIQLDSGRPQQILT